MSKLPEFARERMRQQAPGHHPEADVLAAFAEQALSGGERERVLSHLAACDVCREVVALAAVAQPAAVAAPKQSPKWLGWPVWRWASVGVAVVIVGSAVMSTHLLRSRMQAPAPAQSVVAMQPASPQDAQMAKQAPKSEAAREQVSAALGEVRARRESAPVTRKKMAPTTDEITAKDAVAFKAPVVVPPRRDEKPAAVVAGAAPGMADKSAGLVGGAVPAPAAAPSAESVQVTAAAPPVQITNQAMAAKMQRAAPVAARGGPSQAQSVQQAGTIQQAQAESKAVLERKAKAITPQTTVLFKSALAAPGRWRVSEAGDLERLAAAGWERAPVAAGVTFRVVSTVGLEVWAGGNAGALFHSSDGGERWQRVRPRAGDAVLSADITRIEFTDGVHGKVETANGETWTTADAGRTWARE